MSEIMEADYIVRNLLMNNLNIKLVAIDLDRTLLDTSVARHPFMAAKDVAKYHVKAMFRILVPIILDSRLECCIVTYTWQTKLIRNILSAAFPHHDTSRIRIEGPKQPLPGLYLIGEKLYGKEKYLETILSLIKAEKNLHIKNDEIFLFDDSQKNIDAAIKNNHYYYKVTDQSSVQDLRKHVEHFIRQKENVYKPEKDIVQPYLINKVAIDNSVIQTNNVPHPQTIFIQPNILIFHSLSQDNTLF
ncbi:hypothetical protein HELRODRAFT_168213 [Helobdella robusta]|uniref:FCP1 homology domain-containing protein n=1 Tax=Helobdella robusta TaxID=6412 RepID=T1F0B4_HELRO|nr:hypothetical protein HELRODRAFT_168213 [Helobdella robusta]ESO09251.1 hypothetical protein HELRODRAFT_168213 [Helobdella robusta]